MNHKKHIKLIFICLLLLASVHSAMSQSGLPMLEMNKTTFDFGKTLYLEKKCANIVFKNIGDTTLNIYYADSLKKPFSSNIAYPQSIKKGDSIVFNICYMPSKAGRDSQRVVLRADTRLSHSIGLLIDISTSMADYLPSENKSKLTAATDAIRIFINSMLATPKVSDEAGVFTFAKSFWVNQDFTTNKTLLRNALPTNTTPSTAFYDACAEVINRLKLRPNKKVMIALTDGEDNGSRSYTAASIITLAKASGIKIYTIGVGSSIKDNELSSMATSTGGMFFKANSSKDLQDIYFKIFSLLGKNVETYFDVLGKCDAPSLVMECNKDIKAFAGDTVSYQVDLKAVDSKQALGKNYKLVFKFNKSMLFPVDSGMINYNGNGTIEINKTNNVWLDTVPLTKIKFITLLGDSNCSDISLIGLVWDDSYFAPINTNSTCRICISACARSLSQVILYKPLDLIQNFPNPFENETSLGCYLPDDMNISLRIYDNYGRLVRTLSEGYLKKGDYTFKLDASLMPTGNYNCVLSTENGVISKKITVLK